MTYKLTFDLDPPLRKVIIIGVLIFVEAVLFGYLVYTQYGVELELKHMTTILCVAGLTLVTYLLAFLRRGEIKT